MHADMLQLQDVEEDSLDSGGKTHTPADVSQIQDVEEDSLDSGDPHADKHAPATTIC